MPPFTCIVSPVTYEAWSEDKKATQFDTSSPVPNFPMGILEVKYILTFSAIFKVISEVINPGETLHVNGGMYMSWQN